MHKNEIKKLANHLKAEFNIGKEGISASFITSLYQAFQTKEILKIKKLDNCKIEKKEIVKSLEKNGDIRCIQIIGNVFTLYKEFDKDKE